MRRLFGALALAALAAGITCSCGSSDDAAAPGADGGGGDDASVNDGGGEGGSPNDTGAVGDACGPAVCAQAPGSCGRTVDACGQPVTCGLCKYSGETAATGLGSSSQTVALALAPSVGVAYPGGYAVRTGPAAWTRNAGPAGSNATYLLRLAQASDGTAWIAFRDPTTNMLEVAHAGPTIGADAGVWTTESAIVRYTIGASLAIGSDGVPVVAFAGNDTMGANVVTIARRTGGTWTETPVATSTMPIGIVALAMHGTDPYLVWADRASNAVMFAHATGPTTFATETVEAMASVSGQEALAIAVDASGGVHVAYRANVIHYAARSGTTWTTTQIAPTGPFSELGAGGPVHIAVSAAGRVAIGSLGDSLSMATSTGGAWFNQEIVAQCNGSTPGFDMAFDAGGVLSVAHTCRYGFAAYFVEQGAYPAGYAAACAQAGAAACAAACACPLDAQGKCCVNENGSSVCINQSYCADLITLSLCGDATQDPSVITTCAGALPAAACEVADAGKPGLELPMSCPRP
jgi:hypothetical protein